jgi:diadenylate cyclase
MEQTLRYLDQLIQPLAGWLDILDVLLVTLVFYNVLLLIRGTRAVQVLLGILFLIVFYYTARTLDLPALETTLENVFIILPVAIIVLFQHEIRRALAGFGRTRLLGFGRQQQAAATFNAIAIAASTLAERKIGALIVVERSEGLRNYVENGIALDAVVSLDLLISLFTPETPTHDGAVIVQGDRIAAATCFLPLTRNTRLSKEFGTRHRAALGIAEETDALAVVVSEETGAISVALGGDMIRGLDSNDLRNLLYQSLAPEVLRPELEAA